MRVLLFIAALCLALSSCAAPKYRVVCVPVDDGVIGCIAEPIGGQK